MINFENINDNRDLSFLEVNQVDINLDNRNYDKFKIPASLQLAYDHQKASTFSPPQITSKYCLCCHNKIDKKELSIMCHLDNLQFGGPGIPLFFRYIISCIIMMTIIFFTTGIYTLIILGQSNHCITQEQLKIQEPGLNNLSDEEFKAKLRTDEFKKYCIMGYDLKYTVANLPKEKLDVISYLQTFGIFCIFIFLHYRRYQNRKYYHQYDQDNITPDDFTVQIQNIPKNHFQNITQELSHIIEENFHQIAEHHQLHHSDDKYFQHMHYDKYSQIVNHIEMIYFSDDFVMLDKKIKKLLSKYKKEFNKTVQDEPLLEKLKNEIEECKKEILDLRIKNTDGNEQNFSGSVFVIFERIEYRELFLKYFQTDDLQYFRIQFFNQSSQSHLIKIDKNPLIVIHAEHPHDVLWLNLGVSYKKRLKKQFLANLMVLVLLGCSFYLIKFLNESLVVSEKTGQGDTLAQLFPFLIATFIAILNEVLEEFMIFISNWVQYPTQDELNAAITKRSTFVQFINTAMVTFVVKTLSGQVYSYQTGLLQQQSVIFFSIIFLPTFINLFNIDYRIQQHSKDKAIEDYRLHRNVYNQDELNKIFELPEFRVNLQYSMIQRAMLFASVYCLIIPWGSFVLIIGLIIYYWVAKSLLINYSSLPRKIDHDLVDKIFDQLELCIPLLVSGNYMLQYLIFDEQVLDWHLFFNGSLATLFLLIPSQKLNECIAPLDPPQEYASFSSYEKFFEGSYSGNNPIMFHKQTSQFQTQTDNLKDQN